MSSRFRVDLLHPGQEVQQRGWAGQTSGQWFIGPDGSTLAQMPTSSNKQDSKEYVLICNLPK